MNNLTSHISIQTVILLTFANDFLSVANVLDFPLNLTHSFPMHPFSALSLSLFLSGQNFIIHNDQLKYPKTCNS